MTQSTATEKTERQTATGTDRERIIRKIKRCLALSESANATEAETAMRQAQAMMRNYRLSEIDLHIDSVSSETRNTGMIRMAAWQRALASTAAKAFGCNFLMHKYKGCPVAFEFIGVMPAAELAAYAYDSLLTQVKAARKKFQNDHMTSRRAGDDFCIAWVYSVSTKVTQFAKENQPAEGQTNALMVIEKKEEAAINLWIANRYAIIDTKKEAKRENYNHIAFHHGLQAGLDASINQALSAAHQKQLMIA